MTGVVIDKGLVSVTGVVMDKGLVSVANNYTRFLNKMASKLRI